MSLKRKKKHLSPDQYRTHLKQYKNPIDLYLLIDDLIQEKDNPEFIDVLAELFLDPIDILQNKPMINYKGEILDKSILGIPGHLAFLGKLFPEKMQYIKNCFVIAIKEYYTYPLIVKEILKASEDLQFSKEITEIINTFIWTNSPPIFHVKDVLLEISNYASSDNQENFLFWLIFTPDIVSQDFALNFHKDVFELLIEKLGVNRASLLLYHAILQEIQKNIIDWSILPKNYLNPFNVALNLILDKHIDNITEDFSIERKEILNNILKHFEQSDSEHFLLSFDPINDTEFTNNFISYWKSHLLSRSEFRKNLLMILKFENDSQAKRQLEIIKDSSNFTEEDFRNFLLLLETMFLKKLQKNNIENNREKFDYDLTILVEFMEWQFYQIFSNSQQFDRISSQLFHLSDELFHIGKREKETIFGTYINLVAQTIKEISSQYQFRKAIYNRTKEIYVIRNRYIQREEKFHEHGLNPLPKREMEFNSLIDIIQHQKSRFLKLMFAIDQDWMKRFVKKINQALTKILTETDLSITFKPRFKRISLNGVLFSDFRMSPLIEDDIRTFYRLFDNILNKEQLLKRYNNISFRRIETIIDVVNEFITSPETYEFEIKYLNH
ncbi:MAG: hypothetical protein ACW981_03175 [Candidatus Hodarchaeales archaeon]